MPDVNRGNRPLSPFMIGPYYRPQLTSMSSIAVRITGILSWGTALLLVWWLIAAASSEAAFGFINGLLTGFLGDLILLVATWSIFYHMFGRLRHVIWDLGYFVEVKISELMAIWMIIAASALTIMALIVL